MNKSSTDILIGLPAEKHIRQGLQDLERGMETVSSCLVRIISPKLLRAGLVEESTVNEAVDVELKLYQLLQHEGDRAYSLYNSRLRELASFGHALEQRLKLAA